MSAMQRCFSDLVCQPLVTSYVINTYLCLVTLHYWTMEYQHMMLCFWWWIHTKAESQRSAGEDRRVALATSVSTRFRRMSKIYCDLCCGDLRSPGVTERRNGSLGLRDDDDDDDDDEGCKTCVKKWRLKLIFKASTGCPEPQLLSFENHWRICRV